MDEKQHEISTEDAEGDKEKLQDLEVPEAEVEDVKGGGIDFGGRQEG